MSTTAVLSNPNTNAALPVKTESVDFAVVVKLDEAGKIKSVRHTSSVADINTLKGIGKDNKPQPYTGDEQIAFEQRVTKPSIGSLEGLDELIPDKDVQLDIINKGIASKFNQKIRTALIEQDEAGNLTFQPTDTPFDATALIQEAPLRTNMTQDEKVLKMLANLPQAMQDSIRAAFLAAKTSQSDSE